MSEKKKKNFQVTGVNAFIFILFWVISIAFLQMNSWDIFSSIYTFVARQFPAILQRLWLAYVFHGLVIGLGVGLAQKVAIQALSPIRLKYWLRFHLLVFLAHDIAGYMILRYIDWHSYQDPSNYYMLVSLVSQILLTIGGWAILRKHYQRAWLWLMLLIPALAAYASGNIFPGSSILQALFSALVLVLINRQSIPAEKAKNIAEAEARLEDTGSEEEEISGNQTSYQASQA